MSHFKMAIILADWFDSNVSEINLLSSISQWFFLWIYRPTHRTDLYIVNAAYPEFTKK